MSNVVSCIVFVLLLSMTHGHQESTDPLRFDKIVIFGDSLSDTGNAYKLTNQKWPIVPPYYRGRFCNGPNWVDQLREFQIKNYAYGSATTDNNLVQGTINPNAIPVPGVRQQIMIYLNSTRRNTINFARTLYIFWAGGNDFVFNQRLTPAVIINSLSNGIKDMLAVGAQHILVFNQAPVQVFPYFSRLGQNSRFSVLTTQANAALKTSLATIEQNNTNVSINVFDINKLITEIVANQSSIRFENTFDSCWDAVNTTYVAILCSNPNEYVFIDSFHFTTRVHELIAKGVRPFHLTSFNVSNPNSYIRSV